MVCEDSVDMPRYLVRCLDGEDSAEQVALKAFDEGKRVLWVVNKVARCQRLAKNMKAMCYHSRFKLEDRKERHGQVISAFSESHGPLLAVTTQVCEMSLDLDADVLISETAPLTSMIQRLGRLNRYAHPGSEKLGYAFFYPPEDEMPYSTEDLAGIADVIGFHAKTVSDLRVAFQEAVDDYIESCEKIGRSPQKPYSGKLMLRVPPDLHAKASLAAQISGKSLNQWAAEALERAVQG